MADKRIFVPFGSKKSAELIEKFRHDPFFNVDIKDEQTYNSAFLKYRANLIDIAKTIVDKQKTEYQKHKFNLPFIVQNLHAFYVRNKNISIGSLRINSDILAWFFANHNKIKEHFNIDVKLSNVDSFQQIISWKQKIEETEVPFLDLWENFVNHIIQDKEKSYMPLYPERLSVDLINKEKMVAVLLKKDNVENVFSQFQELMTLTNKDKSCKLCIFNSYETFKRYLQEYNIIILALHPSLGYYRTSDKRGLVVHIISVSEGGLIKEIADYMNDHDVNFPGSLDMLVNLDRKIDQHLHGESSTVDAQKIMSIKTKAQELLTKFPVKSTFLEALPSFYDPATETIYPKYLTIRVIKDFVARHVPLKIFEDIAKNRPSALTKEFVEYIKDFDNIKSLLGETKFKDLQNFSTKTLDRLVFGKIYKILKATDIKIDIKEKKESEDKLEVIFNTTIHNKFTNNQIALETKLVVDKKELSEIYREYYDADEAVVMVYVSSFIKDFINQNNNIVSLRAVENFLESIIKEVIDNSKVDFKELNSLEKVQFKNLVYCLYSLFILREIYKNRNKILDEIEQHYPNIFQLLATKCFSLFVKENNVNLNVDVTHMIDNIIGVFDSKEKINEFQNKLEELKIKKIYKEIWEIKNKSLVLFYGFKYDVHTIAKDLFLQLSVLSDFLDFYVGLESDYKYVLDEIKSGAHYDEDMHIYEAVESGFERFFRDSNYEKHLYEMFQNILKVLYSNLEKNIFRIQKEAERVFVYFVANNTIEKFLEDLY